MDVVERSLAWHASTARVPIGATVLGVQYLEVTASHRMGAGGSQTDHLQCLCRPAVEGGLGGL